MNVDSWPIRKVIPYARNPRRNDASVKSVANSIREFGFRQPIVVDEAGVILVGHTRLKAAQQLGLASVPVHVAEGLTQAQKQAYRIADNRSSQDSTWDMDLLKLEIEDLRLQDFDLELTGFDPVALDDLLGDAEPTAETTTTSDDAPDDSGTDALRRQWGVEPGQVWQLGRHRVLCGDSGLKEGIDRLMDGELADVCFTSPPYSQQRDYQDNATLRVAEWDGLMMSVFGALPMAPTGQVFVNLGMVHEDGEWVPYYDRWIAWMRQQGWRRFGWYVWDQGPGMMGDWGGRLAPAHEWIFHFNRQSVKPQKTKEKLAENITDKKSAGMRGKDGKMKARSSPEAGLQTHKIPDSVVRVNRQSGAGIHRQHVATFPKALPREFIEAWPGLVYEPFCGAGTTIMACEELGRACRAVEISPGYVALTLQRWHEHTGETPELVS